MNFKTLKDFDFSNKTVLLRADINVPTKDGKVSDATRIERLKPTIDTLRKAGAKILILSHFGRPKGCPDPDLSLEFLAPALNTHWDIPITFVNDCVGDKVQATIQNINAGECVLLENVRFYSEEKNNDRDFAGQLADLADIYINDAFSVSHRAHASTEGITHHLPSGAGLLMEAELTALTDALEEPEHPVMAIVGGSKISTKLSVLHNIIHKVDMLFLGGAMPNTFLHALGHDVGGSLHEPDMKEQALQIMREANENQCELILPVDVVAVDELEEGAAHINCDSTCIPADKRAVDMGPKTAALVNNKLETCKTLLWNGPVGVFEIKPFDRATNDIAQCAAKLTQSRQLKTIAGGGDTTAALDNAGVMGEFSYISSAGGAFLEWLEGKDLPGVAALLK